MNDKEKKKLEDKIAKLNERVGKLEARLNYMTEKWKHINKGEKE